MNSESATDKANETRMRRIAILLFIVGFILIVIHYLWLQDQQTHSDENWLITVDTIHHVKQKKTRINIQPPYESRNIRLVGQSIKHTGLRATPSAANAITTKRAIRLRADKPGQFQTVVKFSLQMSQAPHFHKPIKIVMTEKRRQFFLADNEWLKLDNPSLTLSLAKMGQNETEEEKLVEHIFQTISRFANKTSTTRGNAPAILASRSGDHHDRALLMVALCRKAGIPARIVTGLELKNNPSANLQYWVEVYVNEDWLSYHPGLGLRHHLPINFIALDKYGDGFISGSLSGKAPTKKDYSFTSYIHIEKIPDTVISSDYSRQEWYQIAVLDRLPADTREQLSLLMLMPLGTLLCSSLRRIVGFRSYGIFTPTILALALTYAERETTILILAVTLTLVYLGRPTFNHKMSRIPRLSIIYTLVAVSVVIGVSILDYFSLATEGHLVLLPLIIITSLLDRFYSTMEIHGNHTAFVRLAWTMILMLITLPVLQMHWLGALILRYPEAHLFTWSLLILISNHPFRKYKMPGWLGLLTEPENNSQKNIKKTSMKKRNKSGPG